MELEGNKYPVRLRSPARMVSICFQLIQKENPPARSQVKGMVWETDNGIHGGHTCSTSTFTPIPYLTLVGLQVEPESERNAVGVEPLIALCHKYALLIGSYDPCDVACQVPYNMYYFQYLPVQLGRTREHRKMHNQAVGLNQVLHFWV